MNLQKAEELILESQKYIGNDIDVKVLDNKNKLKKIAKCVFEKSTSLSISEQDNEPSIDLYAKLVDKGDGTIYSVSLNKVLTEFKRLENI